MFRDFLAIAVVIIIAFVLITLMFKRNRKDLKEFEKNLNKDYGKPIASEHTDDPDDTKQD